MENINVEKLLSDKRVVEEINRHLWIQSEKAGYDIGFEQAKEDWLKNFSKAWMQYHMPEELIKARKAQAVQSAEVVVEASKKAAEAGKKTVEDAAAVKRRRAKSYLPG